MPDALYSYRTFRHLRIFLCDSCQCAVRVRNRLSVEAKISVDSDEYELKKVQKQKWVKKHGTDTRVFQGNVNEFEINGYPKSQKDFKDFISGIIDEDVFNMITNLNAFNALAWKKQREMWSCIYSGIMQPVFVELETLHQP